MSSGLLKKTLTFKLFIYDSYEFNIFVFIEFGIE